MKTDHLPAPLILGPNQRPGQVAAVILSPTQAYLGWLAYTVSPPAPQDIWYPALAEIRHGALSFDERSYSGLFMERLLAQSSKEGIRVLSFQSILYQADLSDWIIERYHQIREVLWPNSAAPSA